MVPKTLYQHIGFSKVIKELQKLNDFAHAFTDTSSILPEND